MTRNTIRNSALWAAFGDALGFISELAPAAEVQRRVGAAAVRTTVEWKKRVGGKFGVDVLLKPGTYSDDTQLRLSTSRSIRGDGRFDVDAFAKVELPVWLSHALGAGLGTREAASSLAKSSSAWNSNFHEKYMNGGGNGAAMRIQPHVWAAKGTEMHRWLPDVLRNAIVTHGHARALLGAAFHAAILAETLQRGKIPSVPEAQVVALKVAQAIPDALRADRDVRDFWLPRWERQAKRAISSAIEETYGEIKELLHFAEHAGPLRPEAAYAGFLNESGALARATVGSGTITSVAAYHLARVFAPDASEAMVVAANAYGSDTDSIATMAGAILGAVVRDEPHGAVMDSEYILAEADRCFALANEQPTSSFPYPDLLNWKAPEAANSAVGAEGNRFQIAGLGYATAAGPEFVKDKPEAVWRWLRTDYGQHLLVKTRKKLTALPASQMPVTPEAVEREAAILRTQIESVVRNREVTLPFEEQQRNGATTKAVASPESTRESLHELTKRVIDSGFEPDLVGVGLIRAMDDGIEAAIAYAAIIAKARVSRQSKQR